MSSGLLRIGISGHRFMDTPALLRRSICTALKKIQEKHPGGTFQLLSPLSAGADQLAAACALEAAMMQLVVILPLPLDEYLEDFSAAERSSFMRLYEARAGCVNLPASVDRESAYLKAGETLVAHCDCLIAVWNGKEERGTGGTAQVVRMAMEKGLPIAWIRAHNAIPGGMILLDEDKEQGSIEWINFPTNSLFYSVADLK